MQDDQRYNLVCLPKYCSSGEEVVFWLGAFFLWKVRYTQISNLNCGDKMSKNYVVIKESFESSAEPTIILQF